MIATSQTGASIERKFIRREDLSEQSAGTAGPETDVVRAEEREAPTEEGKDR